MSQDSDRRTHADALRRHNRSNQSARFKRQGGIMLASIALGAIIMPYRAQGWQDVRASLERPDNYYNMTHVHPAGVREATEAEQTEIARIEVAIAARIAELGEDNYWGDGEISALRHERHRADVVLTIFTEEQKADSAMMLFIGNGGAVEAKAIRTKRAKATGIADTTTEQPDYSGAVIETLSKIKTLAVQEAVATNPALALDILLDCLVSQSIHNEPSYQSPLSLRLEGFNAFVSDEMMTQSTITPVSEMGAADYAAVPQRDRFAAIQSMDADTKARLLALLVAGQINGTLSSATRPDRRHGRFAQIAAATGIDITSKWQAPVAFYDRLKKPVILKIMAEELGASAADNCAKMKKGDLAIAAAERMSGRDWLPPALRIVRMEAEGGRELAPSSFVDDGDLEGEGD